MSFSLGYPRFLSGDMLIKKNIHEKQSTLFPELAIDTPWNSITTTKRHFLQFPFYPFRTLNTRELTTLGPINEFESSSPIFPANTQLNINFRRRDVATLLNHILPYNLNYNKGSTTKGLTAVERVTALTFSVPEGAAFKDYSITAIEINVKDIYLEVRE